MADLLFMGKVGKPHGIKGETGVYWYGENPLPENSPVFIGTASSPKAYFVKGARQHHGKTLVALEGVNTRDEAEALAGQSIFLPKSSLPPLQKDEAFSCELPGSEIFLADGVHLGKLDHIEYPANQEIWAIHDDAGHEILFPAQPCFIEKIDLDNKRIKINPPAGLLDIYLA